MALQNGCRISHPFQFQIPPSQSELLVTVTYSQQHLYESNFCLVGSGHQNRRVVATNKEKEKYHWAWISYCKPLGLDPILVKETTSFTTKIQKVTGFSARVKQGYFGFGRQIAAGIVTAALTAVGQVFSLDNRGNPLKSPSNVRRVEEG